ncbi:MAG TPA: TonB-dependent receptor [Micropepsaceae bacterium]|nr:TonB-dependent receptor [Micropepsaceae bacterium]
MRGKIACLCLLTIAAASPAGAQQQTNSVEDLGRLSIDELANLQITSVTRQAQPLSSAAAAVYVITNEDIRRSGATSVAEALRLAPNLQVARQSASSYGIAARGFNHYTSTANKLQVMIDGRVVYTPLYSGVFWDEQDVPLADIDRIEVISGPGGAVWGSNAVDGVINIITRNSRDTQGGLVDLQGGSLDQLATLRYGGKLGEDANYRVYAMGAKRGTLERPNGSDAGDSWDKLQGGFRTDWSRNNDSLTLQGDLYNATTEDQPPAAKNATISGANLLGRWTRQFGADSALQTQLYFARSERNTTSGIEAAVDTYDFDVQYSFAAGSAQNFVVGAGDRVTADKFVPAPNTSFLDPPKRTLNLANIFLQDQIEIAQDLTLTLGIKAEHNDYTGMEYMPDMRLGWRVFGTDLVWGGISRAARTPSRFDTDLMVTGVIAGGPDFVSEHLTAFELGYRGQPTRTISFSASAFYNVYDHLRTVESFTPAVFPVVILNNMKGETYGVELWGNYAALPWWRLSAGLSTLRKDLRLDTGSRDIFGVRFAGNDPSYQASLRSSMDLANAVELDITLRAVDDLPSPRIPGYLEADMRLGWHVTKTLELAVVGTNLLHARHTEFVNPSLPVEEIPRSVTASARWQF